jgi:GNAT superfamily N-acetyltransferase
VDRDAALELQRQSMRDFVTLMGSCAPGSRLLERDGITASAVPATPGRSIPNSVTYTDPDVLLAGLAELAAFYDDAGIDAWTVWAPDFESETIAALEDAGHAFDGRPAAMVLDLTQLDESELGDLDWDAEASLELLGELNDRAYGHAPGEGYAAGWVRVPEGLDLRLFQARVDGKPASILGTIDHEPVVGTAGRDCGIYFVATAEEYRGRGLSTRLMRAALSEARERGCATSSLQASAMGEPVYERLGYRPYFRFHMYERRRPG